MVSGRRWERSWWSRFLFISLLCPWLCADMGVQQLSWCRYMCNGGEAAQFRNVGWCWGPHWLCKQGLATLRVDGYRPSQTQEWQVLSGAGIGYVRYKSMCMSVCVQYLQCVLGNLWGNGFRLCACRCPRWTRCHCMSDTPSPSCLCYRCDKLPERSRCSSPLCKLYTSGNEIHVLHVKRNFVCVGQGVTPFPRQEIPPVEAANCQDKIMRSWCTMRSHLITLPYRRRH